MNNLKEMEHEVSTWPSTSVHPHRFGGREFRFGSAAVGHVHTGGIVDIPFPRPVRDALLADGLAEEHHWIPKVGLLSVSELKKTSTMACGCCGSHMFGTPSKRLPMLGCCWRGRVRSCD